MFVTYQPEGAEVRRWVFDPEKIRISEAEIIEKRSGQTWEMFLQSVQTGSLAARRVLLWTLLKRDHLSLRWDDCPDPYASELLVEYSAAELREILANLKKATHVQEDEREKMIIAFKQEIKTAEKREEAFQAGGQAEAVEGKVRSKTGDGNTRGS